MANKQVALIFGCFLQRWAWRVEWLDARGKLQFQDFPQDDLAPAQAKVDADAFRLGLQQRSAA